MAITIGDVTIDAPVLLAPMTGVTDKPFREIVQGFGAGLVFSEMIASRPTVERARRDASQYAPYDEDYPIGAQIAGCEPDIMAEAAKLNEARGAKIIDINFGCPVKKIVNNFGGSALMKDEKLAADIVAAVVRAVKIPVTVKMRLGWDDTSLNAASMAKAAESLGAQMITVHGRTRCQLYNGQANWDAVRAVKDAVCVPVIVNGDIVDTAAAQNALQKSGADGVMVGRGAFGRPWIIHEIIEGLQGNQIEKPTGSRLRDLILTHYDKIIDYHGADTGVRIARKHIGWYLTGYEGSEQARTKINQMTDPDDVRAALRDYFARA